MLLKKITATKVLEDVVEKQTSDRVPISDLANAMEEVGFGLAILIFALGTVIPLPPPFPSIISIPLVIFSWQMAIGCKSPKLPKRFAKMTVKRSVLVMLINKSSPYIRRIEKILRPRLVFMTSKISERIVGGFVFLFSSFILLPMPLSNFLPGLGILVIAFGLLSKDGLAILLGIIVGITGITISVLTVLLGFEFLHYLKDWLF